MIPADVQALIAHIPSTAGLSALLLLHRSVQTYWTPHAVAVAIGATADAVYEAMAKMEAAGLLARASATVAFRYSPESVAIQASVDRLVAEYQRDKYAVIDTLRGAAGIARPAGGQ
jgi:hypothetical protein